MMLRRCLLAAGLLWLGGAALADDAAERQRIAAERQAIASRFAAEEADCHRRFVVTSCVDAARARQREALNLLRHQELLLDDAERKQRAAARLDAIEARRAAAASQPAPAPVPPSSPSPRAEPPPPRPPTVPHAASPSASTAEAQAAARRAAAAKKRREDAAADRARIAEREAQHAAGGKKAAPLPLPASAP